VVEDAWGRRVTFVPLFGRFFLSAPQRFHHASRHRPRREASVFSGCSGTGRSGEHDLASRSQTTSEEVAASTAGPLLRLAIVACASRPEVRAQWWISSGNRIVRESPAFDPDQQRGHRICSGP